MLSKLLLLIVLLTIGLSSADYALKLNFLNKNQQVQDSLFFYLSRNIKHIELAMNVRSLFNIGNGVEFERYLDPQL